MAVDADGVPVPLSQRVEASQMGPDDIRKVLHVVEQLNRELEDLKSENDELADSVVEQARQAAGARAAVEVC